MYIIITIEQHCYWHRFYKKNMCADKKYCTIILSDKKPSDTLYESSTEKIELSPEENGEANKCVPLLSAAHILVLIISSILIVRFTCFVWHVALVRRRLITCFHFPWKRFVEEMTGQEKKAYGETIQDI